MTQKQVRNRILILGIGNILLQDEGAGIWAVRKFQEEYIVPSNVEVIEGGTGGVKLLSLIEEFENLIIIDTVRGNGQPGEVYRLFPGDIKAQDSPLFSTHEGGIIELLYLSELFGKRPHVIIIGIQPLEIAKIGLDLTPPIYNSLGTVIKAVIKELKRLNVPIKKRITDNHGSK